MRRTSVVIVLALVVLSAGCSSLLPGDGPATGTETPAPLTGRLAPGLDADGITDAYELVGAHDRILREDSYTARSEYEARYANGTVHRRSEGIHRRGANGSHRFASNVSGTRFVGSSGRLEEWSDGQRSLQAITMGGRTQYMRGERWGTGTTSTHRDRLYVLLTALNVTSIDRTGSTGHVPVYSVEATEISRPDALAAADEFESVDGASLVLVVDTWGMVREFRYEATGTKGGEPFHLEQTVRFTDIGETTVTRPPWYDRAVENTSRG